MNSHDLMPNYDEDAVQPMRTELTAVGFAEMRSPDDVDRAFDGPGTAVVVINSVCGCAAGGARPGVTRALQNSKIPDRLVTSFAGQDKAAVNRIRQRLSSIPPSSPFIAVLKDGKPVHVMQRSDIEGKDANRVASELVAAFNQHCARSGPSIPAEQYAKLTGVQVCGSSIPPSTVKIQGMGGMGSTGSNAGHGQAVDAPGKKGWQFWK